MRANAVIVNSVISILRVILQALEIPLGIFQAAKEQISTSSPPSQQQQQHSTETKTVVIVGGNFAGLAALKQLVASTEEDNFCIVLIDQRDYSEYTPGILRLFCEPNLLFDLAQPLPKSNKAKNYECIQGKVTSLVENEDAKQKILTYIPTASSSSTSKPKPQTLVYDYVIVATGATYTSPISPTPQEYNLHNRYNGWKAAHERLQTAKRVIVLGGGAVGVELAAEIVDAFADDKKKVTLLDAQPQLVNNFPKQVGDYAQRWLEQQGVTVMLGQSLKSWTETTCTLQDGTVREADLVYVCFGSRPNSMLLEQKPETTNASLLCSLTKRRNIQVADTLQVVATNSSNDESPLSFDPSCIFACGDVASPSASGEDQAFQAETQGKVAAKNVLAMLDCTSTPPKKKMLCRYPQDIAGASQMPMVYILSLGKSDGVLGFNSLIIPGPLAAIAKFVLEYTKVLDMRGSLLGRLVWKIADAVVLFLSRTVLRPSKVTTSKDVTQTKRLKVA